MPLNTITFLALQYGPRYNWTSAEQSMLLGSYFWGYLFTTLPGGMLAEWLGGRSVVGWSMAASAVLTAVVPILAGLSYWSVIVMRFATGVAAVSSYFLFENNKNIMFNIVLRNYAGNTIIMTA